MRRVRVLLLAFAAFFALSATFAVTDPLGAPIDESQHMAWAAAVSDGQIAPHRYNQEVFWGRELILVTTKVQIPREIALLNTEIDCFAQRPNKSAKCYRPINHSTRTVAYHTTMGSYNPAYYMVVGWPVHVLPGLYGLYAMRLISALLCSVLLAFAALLALRIGRVAFCGVLVAATPMALFLAGSVNPNGPEAAGGLLAFTALSALALDPQPALVRSRFTLFALGTAVVTVVRPAGLEWFVVFAVMAVLLLGGRHLVSLVRDRRCWLPLGGLLVSLMYAAAWDLTRGGLNSVPVKGGNGYTVQKSVADSLNEMPGAFRAMIGTLGWNDTAAPFGTEAVWLGLLGVLLIGAALLANRRQSLILAAWLTGIVLMPMVANALTAKGLLNLWEGRYGLWFAVGLPVYAAMLIGTRTDALPRIAARIERRMTAMFYLAVVFGQLAMYWLLVRRYGMGLAVSPLAHHFAWEPPKGWLPGFALLLIGLALDGLLLWRFTARGLGTQPEERLAPESEIERQRALKSSTEIVTAV